MLRGIILLYFLLKPIKENYMAEIKPEVVALAKTLKSQMTLGDNGVVTYNDPKAVFETTLTDTGLDMKQVKALHDHRDTLIAAQGQAVGELALDAFKKDKNLSQVSVEMKCAKDVIGSTVSRHKSFNDGKGGKIERYGVLNTRYEANGAGKRGQLKIVRDNLMEAAKELYK